MISRSAFETSGVCREVLADPILRVLLRWSVFNLLRSSSDCVRISPFTLTMIFSRMALLD